MPMENIADKNRPVAINFQFLKMLCPSGTALLQRSRIFEVALVGAKPLHLACVRPGCHSNAPLGRSLLRKRGLVGACLPQTLLLTIWKLHDYAPLGPRELTLIGGIEL